LIRKGYLRPVSATVGLLRVDGEGRGLEFIRKKLNQVIVKIIAVP